MKDKEIIAALENSIGTKFEVEDNPETPTNKVTGKLVEYAAYDYDESMILNAMRENAEKATPDKTKWTPELGKWVKTFVPDGSCNVVEERLRSYERKLKAMQESKNNEDFGSINLCKVYRKKVQKIDYKFTIKQMIRKSFIKHVINLHAYIKNRIRYHRFIQAIRKEQKKIAAYYIPVMRQEDNAYLMDV